jgi:transcriptional regulator with AAA-type ATPase domain/NAD-dependent dihydropyrimidine dehydrogenase PreA subunit
MSTPVLTLAWLQERTTLNQWSTDVLTVMVPQFQWLSLAPQKALVVANQVPAGLYILVSGHLEYRQAPGLGTTPLPANLAARSPLPGATLFLTEVLLEQPSLQTVLVITASQFWFLPAMTLRAMAQQFPELGQMVSRQLAQDLAQAKSDLAFEQERQGILRPYLVPKVKRGIVGSSRYAIRLRQQLNQAARDRQPVLVSGEPGLEKDNAAALIHFGSPWRREPMIQVNCATLPASGADLFGRGSGKPGLLEAVGDGTILLNNIQDLPPALLPKILTLLETGTYQPVQRDSQSEESDASLTKISAARLMIVSEKICQGLDKLVPHQVKVPPLRVRKTDLKAQIDYYLALLSQKKGIPRRYLTPEALRRLQAYNFPGNLAELQNLIERAIAQAPETLQLTDEVFWPAEAKKQRFRVNLLNAYPQLRQFLRSPWWPTRINYGFTLVAFALLVLVLFLGPQDRQHNFGLNLFWAWWWPLVLVGFPFVGRLWCAICPFMIYGEVVQKLSLWLWPRQLKRWPRDRADRWGGWFLVGLFALIFLWEELWQLENTAYLSSCLLLLITAGAVIFSVLFERRFWCRYLCPIGGMNGLYAKLAVTELRAQQGTCSAECTTYQCYKGGPVKGEGQDTDGCPLYSHPAQLVDNRDCVLCMTCLKACPHRSVELNLRPPGIELWTTHVPRSYEVALLLLLLGGIFLHRLPEVQAWLGWDLRLAEFWPHAAVSVAVLTLVALIPYLGHCSFRLVTPQPPRPFVELAYGYLPLVLGGTLAHYLRLGLTEAGQILPVTLATFGDASASLPSYSAHPAVIAFLQATTLVVSVGLTLWLSQKISRQPFWSLLPQHLTALLLAVGLWQLIVGA